MSWSESPGLQASSELVGLKDTAEEVKSWRKEIEINEKIRKSLSRANAVGQNERNENEKAVGIEERVDFCEERKEELSGNCSDKRIERREEMKRGTGKKMLEGKREGKSIRTSSSFCSIDREKALNEKKRGEGKRFNKEMRWGWVGRERHLSPCDGPREMRQSTAYSHPFCRGLPEDSRVHKLLEPLVVLLNTFFRIISLPFMSCRFYYIKSV